MWKTRNIALAAVLVSIAFLAGGLILEHLRPDPEPSALERESQNVHEGLQMAIKSMSWKGSELEVEYTLTYVHRQGPVFSKKYAVAIFRFWTAEGVEIDVRRGDPFALDESFQSGYKPILFGLKHVPCDSQTALLSVDVPENAAYVAVGLGRDEFTKRVRLPDRPRR